MKRTYSRTILCSHDGCKECGYYTFSSQKEYADHFNRVKDYKCTRHLKPKEVLSIENPFTSTKIICKIKLMDNGEPLGKFWQHEEDLGTNKVSSAFQYGNGYKAFANDFPEGTIITINASVTIPKY